jgi:hypothetical protein
MSADGAENKSDATFKTAGAGSWRRKAALCTCVLLMTLAMGWLFFGFRTVMAVGGSCMSGHGPYVSRLPPCPGSVSFLMPLGFVLMIISALAAGAFAKRLQAPSLMLSMWWLTFGFFGWNFLTLSLAGGEVVRGIMIVGVVFMAMALPALLFQLWLQPPWTTGTSTNPNSRFAARWHVTSPAYWYGVYIVLGSVGFTLAWWSST